jgi:hypothetical protein
MACTEIREVVEGIQHQGVDEEIAYSVTTTPYGPGPTNVAIVAKDVTNSYLDVSSTVLTGSSSVVGDVITLPKLKGLTLNHLYRIEVKFSSGGDIFEPYFLVQAEL